MIKVIIGERAKGVGLYQGCI